MNADASAGVGADIDVGITAPIQKWAARALLIVAAALAVLGIALILIGVYRRRPSAHPAR